MKVSEIQKRVMHFPYSDCIEVDRIDTVMSREMKRLEMIYSRRNCLLLCQQKIIIENIGCYSLTLPPAFNAQPCSTDDQFFQIRNLNLNFSNL